MTDDRDAEIARLRAIIEGRATPPTREEWDAHLAAHHIGGWMICYVWPAAERRRCACHDERTEITVFRGRYPVEEFATRPAPGRDGLIRPVRYVPLDDEGRACSWPVARAAEETPC